MLSQLKNLGLSDKEAKVYLASLELGPSTIQIIAKKAGIKRATAYSNIESLIKRGLVSSFVQGKKNYFTSESPERLLSLLRVEEKELREKKREFKTVLDDLKSLEKLTKKDTPVVRFFEGVEGIEAIRQDILKTKIKSLNQIVNLDKAYEMFPPGPSDHRKKMREKLKKIPERMIYTSKKGAILAPRQNSIKLRTKFIESDKFDFFSEILIYNNKVAIICQKNQLIGTILENSEITQSIRAIFEFLWKNIKSASS